tara:strand:+ start:1383 stop:2123 length:741 start_codon:yes stop_codon:yes gene_type:complete
MENLTLVALSRMSVLRNQMATIANNVANADTDGFKSEHVMFDDYVVKTRGGESSLKAKISFVSDVASYTDLSKGPLVSTGNDLDVSIAKDGYFVVEGRNDNEYTANGRFSLNPDGELITAGDKRVLNTDNEPIVIDGSVTTIDISRQGTISADGAEIGKLQVVRFDNPQELERIANGLYRAPQRITPQVMDNPDLVQGSIEESNVEPILQMSQMIEVHRAYESTSRLMSQDHDRQRKAIDILTRTN